MDNVHKSWNKHLPTYAIITDICECYPSMVYKIMENRLINYYGFPLTHNFGHINYLKNAAIKRLSIYV